MGRKSDSKKSSRHKFRGRNERDSRLKYWRYDVLMRHKVRNLVRSCGMTREEAIAFWKAVRKTRIKKGT